MTDSPRMFGLLYPLLDAYPTVDAIAVVLPAWHRWHRRPDLVLDDLGAFTSADEPVSIQRIDASRAWGPENVVVVDVPEELRAYHRVEHETWLAACASRAPT